MKIIVDEAPKHEWQCLFCEREYNYGGYFCKFSKDVCNIDMCNWLKPIDEFYQDRIEKFFEPLSKLMDEDA